MYRYLTDVSTKVDTYQQPREPVRGGAVWVGRTVGAMDGAIEPPWMGSRRVLPTHTAHPTDSPLLLLMLLLHRPLQVQGCKPY